MNLLQHKTELLRQEGEFLFTITKHECGTYQNGGDPWVDYFISTSAGDTKVRFNTRTTPSAGKKHAPVSVLVGFAQACGVTDAELSDFNHGLMRGRMFMGTTKTNDKGYLEVVKWRSAPADIVAAAGGSSAPDTDEDLPF